MGIVIFLFVFAIFCFAMAVISMKINKIPSNVNNPSNVNKVNDKPLKSTKEYTIVGVTHSHFGNHSQVAFQDLMTGEPLFLYADTNNKYDSDAVVIKTYDDKYVGWLPKGCKDIQTKLINGPDNVTATLSEKYILYDDDGNEKTYKGKTMYGGNIKVNIY